MVPGNYKERDPDEYQGTIKLESKEGEGATLTVKDSFDLHCVDKQEG